MMPTTVIQPVLARERRRFAQRVGQELRHPLGVGIETVADQEYVDHDERQENRQQDLDRFLHAAQVEHQQYGGHEHAEGDFPLVEPDGEQAEKRVRSGRDGDRDGQHVIHDQRRPGHEPRVRADQARRDLVAAAAVGKELDHLVVGERDDEYRHRDGEGEVEPEVLVGAQGEIGFLGAVARRGQPVGAEAHPREERDQGDAVAGTGIERVTRLADQYFAQAHL
jgi:hypothetical protein